MEGCTAPPSTQKTDTEEKSSAPIFADIREHWDWVKPGLEAIIKADPFLGVIPEDVYAACKAEDAHLWVSDAGFVVTTGLTDPYTKQRTLLIWFAWAAQKGRNIAVEHVNFFERAALDAGFSYLEVRTRYKPLAEYIEKSVGWGLETMVYRRDLSYEQ